MVMLCRRSLQAVERERLGIRPTYDDQRSGGTRLLPHDSHFIDLTWLRRIGIGLSMTSRSQLKMLVDLTGIRDNNLPLPCGRQCPCNVGLHTSS